MLCVFCVQKDSLQMIFVKKLFLFTVGSVCRVKRFTTGSRDSRKDVRKTQMIADQRRKWFRQQSKYLHAAGFDALGQVYQCLWRMCREIDVFFFQVRISPV
jgi:hypothetical protein